MVKKRKKMGQRERIEWTIQDCPLMCFSFNVCSKESCQKVSLPPQNPYH